MFEQEVFREMAVENVRIVESLKQLHNDRQMMEIKQNRICQALGDTHKIECRFKVQMNQAGTAINWDEVKDEVKDDGKETPGDGGGEPSGEPDSPPESTGDDNGAAGAEAEAEGKTEAKVEGQ